MCVGCVLLGARGCLFVCVLACVFVSIIYSTIRARPLPLARYKTNTHKQQQQQQQKTGKTFNAFRAHRAGKRAHGTDSRGPSAGRRVRPGS